nr:transcription termination/antitermination protein NusG [Actinomycetota bacterium]
MSERYSGDDVDWATAAEQSSEDDEAQEGDVLASEERAVEAAERVALHIEGDDDADADDEDIEFEEDPEADAIVNDALNLDQAAESEAAASVLNDSVAEEAADREAAAADEVTPYDGPDVNGEEDAPVLDPEEVAEIDAAAGVVDAVESELDPADAASAPVDADEDPYESFRMDLRMLPGKWYV